MMEVMGKFVDLLGGKYFIVEDLGIVVIDLKLMVKYFEYIVGVDVQYYYVGEILDGNFVFFMVYGVFVGVKVLVEYGLNRSLEGVIVVI